MNNVDKKGTEKTLADRAAEEFLSVFRAGIVKYDPPFDFGKSTRVLTEADFKKTIDDMILSNQEIRKEDNAK